jgi:hypothetical protein
MFSHSISIAFNKQDNPPLRPPHKTCSTAPHSLHIIFLTSVPRSSSKQEQPAICFRAIWLIHLLSWQTVVDFVPLASGSKLRLRPHIRGSVAQWILQVEVYWVLQWVTVGGRTGRWPARNCRCTLQYCSTRRRRAELGVEWRQLKRNVKVHSGQQIVAVLCCGCRSLYRSWFYRCVCGLGSGEQGLRYIKSVQKCRGVKNVICYKALINSTHGTVQHVVLL